MSLSRSPKDLNTKGGSSSSSCGPSTAASPAQYKDDATHSLEQFLNVWTTRGDSSFSLTQENGSDNDAASSMGAFLSSFPPPLPRRLPRSFRPCEIVPAVYLGSWQDVGSDVAALMQRLEEHTHTAPPPLSSPSSSPSCVASRQRMVLLLRACPLPTVTTPQLELHVARARKTASSTSPAPASRRRSETPAAAGREEGKGSSSATRERAGSVAATRDIEVLTLPLTELQARVCAAVRSTQGTSTEGAGLAAWLCPGRAPSRAAGAKAEASFPRVSAAEWQTAVGVVQDVLLEDHRTAVPPQWPDWLFYWRLVLPLLDSPTQQIQHFFPIIVLVMHAVLSLSRHPRYAAWMGDTCGESASSVDCPPTDTSTESARRETGDAAALSIVQPCVVVHCLAGKSRSASFVAAFLLHEWMLWYTAQNTPNDSNSSSKPSPSASEAQALQARNSTSARRVVDAVIAHLRSRRLCVDVNLGFDAQLWDVTKKFLNTL